MQSISSHGIQLINFNENSASLPSRSSFPQFEIFLSIYNVISFIPIMGA